MLKKLTLALAIAGLAACGGASNDASDTTPSTPLPDESNEYLSYMKGAYTDQLGENAAQLTDRATDGNAVESSPLPSSDTSNDFSGTNVQILGVDEANSLKFDGNNLLSLNRQANYQWWDENNDFQPKVRLFNEAVLAGNANEDDSLHFEPSADYQYTGLLSHGEQAALVGTKSLWFSHRPIEPFIATDIACFDDCGSAQFNESDVIAYTWDYAQAGTPVAPAPAEIVIDGSLVETRLIENKLYIISRFSPNIQLPIPYPQTVDEQSQNQNLIDALTIADVTPTIEINGQSELLFDGSDCRIEKQEDGYFNYPTVISITQIDLSAPTDWRASCYVGNVAQAFVSANAVYLSSWSWSDNMVAISKYALTDSGPEYRASGNVEGDLSYDSYFFGEVDGKLTYINTLYDTEFWNSDPKHQLTVFEENGSSLDIVAQLPNASQPEPIGKPGERIYSVRFMGRRAYIVTFEQIDPLYVIDLSEPTAPQILGELEIPGFSSYLHVINEDLIIGVGRNTVNDRGRVLLTGLNLRLFDVSDPATPSLVESLDYGLRGSESEVFNSPHAFSFVNDTENSIFRFALPMELHGNANAVDPDKHAWNYHEWSEGGLYQFEVNTGETPSLAEVGRFTRDTQAEDYWYYLNDDRSVIDGHLVYYAHDEKIDVFEWGGSTALRSFEND